MAGLRLYLQKATEYPPYQSLAWHWQRWLPDKPPKPIMGETIWEIVLKECRPAFVTVFQIKNCSHAGLYGWARRHNYDVLENSNQYYLINLEVIDVVRKYQPGPDIHKSVWVNLVDGQQVLSTMPIGETSYEYIPK